MDWLRLEDLKEEKEVTVPIPIIPVEERMTLWRCRGIYGVPLGMHRMNPECPGSGHADRWVAGDLLLRQEPEDDEEEDDGTDNDDDDDDENNDGYSERACPGSSYDIEEQQINCETQKRPSGRCRSAEWAPSRPMTISPSRTQRGGNAERNGSSSSGK